MNEKLSDNQLADLLVVLGVLISVNRENIYALPMGKMSYHAGELVRTDIVARTVMESCSRVGVTVTVFYVNNRGFFCRAGQIEICDEHMNRAIAEACALNLEGRIIA